MTYQSDFTVPAELLEQIAAEGFDVLPELSRIVFNAAMQAERQQYLGAAPYQHTAERRDQANGYKPKAIRTRQGEITLDIPQVRGGGLYPQALEKGLRSEVDVDRLNLALVDVIDESMQPAQVSLWVRA